MTYLTFLTLNLASIVLGAPKALGKRQVTSIKPTCARTTICIHAQNDCAEWYGGCYDMCSPTTFYPPPCPASSVAPTATASSSSLTVITTDSLGAAAATTNPVVSSILELAEKVAEDADGGDNNDEDDPLTVEDPPMASTPTASTTTDESPPWVTEAAETTATSTTSEESPLWLTVDDDPNATITAAPMSSDPPAVQCGLTTSCYDWLNDKCTPAYRWGTCVDVCSASLVSEPPCPTPNAAPAQEASGRG